MDKDTAIARITEIENLTGSLEDDDANWLLDWGIARVDAVLAGTGSDEQAGDRLNHLMAVMRAINQITGDRADKPPRALAADIAALRAQYAAAFGRTPTLSPRGAALRVATLPARAALEYLTGLLEPPPTATPSPTTSSSNTSSHQTGAPT